MDRGSAADSGLIRSAKLPRHGPVEGKKVFYWFQNAAGRGKRKKEEPERSSKWPSVLKARNWTSLFRLKRSSSVQDEEVDRGFGADSRLIRSVRIC
ncbi:hypothetical protein SUGI_0313730 [Cryptomeria japonica]|nr:hypothetical protein SUGI_0313730 [Cryptomeria japonica]